MHGFHSKQLLFMSGLVGVLSALGIQAAHAQSGTTSPEPVSLAEFTSEPVGTSAVSLQPASITAQATSSESEAQTAQAPVAQTFAPGRATRSGASYIAVGGNIGFGGSTGIGRGNGVVTSKIGLTNNFSARPGVLIGNRTTVLVPVTVDFPTATVIDQGRIGIAPFVGGGIAISTGDDSLVRPMITAGVDVPIAERVTGVASANVGFFRETEVGLMLGVGYNF